MRMTFRRSLLLLLLGAALASCSSSSAEKKPDWWSQRQQEAQKEQQQATDQPATQAAEQPAAAQQPPAEGAAQQTQPPADQQAAQSLTASNPPGAAAAAAAGTAAATRAATPPPPPVMREEPPAEPAASTGIPYEKAFPEAFKQIAPVRIGILSNPRRPVTGEQIALIIGTFQRERLERALGRPLRIAFISRSAKPNKTKTLLRYRPDFLKAAIQVATAIPAAQVVEPMSEDELTHQEIDLFIYIGSNIP